MSKIISKNILDLIVDEIDYEKTTLSLIPSENIMSPLATSMYSGKSSNRYLLPLKIGTKYFMPGRENLEQLIKILEKKLCAAYKTKYVITKALSGLHQMDIIMSALRKKTDKIIIINTTNGGHSKTTGVAKKYGFDIELAELEFKNWDIDYEKFKIIINKWKGQKVSVYIDHTVTVNPLDINKLIQIIPSDWIVYYDISHLQLFYFSHIFHFPKYRNFFFGGSTHKTFPGPQKAIILLNNPELYKLISDEFFKTISSVHTGSLLALLVTVIEMEKFGVQYAKDILVKTRYFAKLLSRELKIVGTKSTLTNTHQIWIDVPNPLKVIQRLASVGIITYPIRIPSIYRTGLRLGIQEQCRMGIEEKDLLVLSEIIISCVMDKKLDLELKNKVGKIAKKLKTVKYVLA